MSETRKTVVWWRHFERHQEVMTLGRFEELKRSWGAGDCAIETVDGIEALDPEKGWVWGTKT